MERDGIRGVSLECGACDVVGSPLESEWRLFLNCPHSVHKECAEGCEGVCPKCGSASPFRIVNREIVTSIELDKRLKKALNKHETKKKHLMATLDRSAGAWRSLDRVMKYRVVQARENRKWRIKQRRHNEKKGRRLNDADDDANESVGTSGDAEESADNAADAAELGGESRSVEGEETEEERDEPYRGAEAPDSSVIPPIPEEVRREEKERRDKEEMDKAWEAVKEDIIRGLGEDFEGEPEKAAELCLSNLMLDIIQSHQMQDDLARQCVGYLDNVTENQALVMESVSKAQPTMYNDLMEALPDAEEDLNEAARIVSEMNKERNYQRHALEQLTKFQSTLEIRQREQKEEDEGVDRSPKPLQAVQETIELGKEFGIHIQTIRSDAADRVALEMERRGRDLPVNASIVDIMTMCDLNREIPPQGRRVDVFKFDREKPPNSIPELVKEVEELKRQRNSFALMLKMIAIRLEISERGIRNRDNTHAKMVRFQEVRQEQNKEVHMAFEVFISMLLSELCRERLIRQEALKILEEVPERASAMVAMFRMDGPQDDMGEKKKMTIHRDSMACDIDLVSRKLATGLPPEEKEERLAQIKDGMTQKMNLVWAEPQPVDKRWTKGMAEALWEEMTNPVPQLESLEKKEEEDKGPLPPIVPLSDERRQEALNLAIAESGGPRLGPHDSYKPLSQTERRAFINDPWVRKMNNDFMKWSNINLLKIPIDYEGVRKEWEDADLETEEEKEERMKNKKGKEGKKQKGKKAKEGEMLTTKEELEEMKKRGGEDQDRTGKAGMMVQWTNSDGSLELQYFPPEEIPRLIEAERRVKQRKEIEREMNAFFGVKNSDSEDSSEEDEKPKPQSSPPSRASPRGASGSSPRAMSLHTHSRQPTPGRGRPGASTSPSNMGKTFRGPRELTCWHCGVKGHHINECPTIKCWRCGEIGHHQKVCQAQKSDKNDGADKDGRKEKKDDDQDKKKDGNGQSICAVEMVEMEGPSGNEEEEEKEQLAMLEEVESDDDWINHPPGLAYPSSESETENDLIDNKSIVLEEEMQQRLSKNQKRKLRVKRKKEYKKSLRAASDGRNTIAAQSEEPIAEANPEEAESHSKTPPTLPSEAPATNSQEATSDTLIMSERQKKDEQIKEMIAIEPKGGDMVFKVVDKMLLNRLFESVLEENVKEMVLSFQGQFFRQGYESTSNEGIFVPEAQMTIQEALGYHFLIWHCEDWIVQKYGEKPKLRSEAEMQDINAKKISAICRMLHYARRCAKLMKIKGDIKSNASHAVTMCAVNAGSDDEMEHEASKGQEVIVDSEDESEVPVIKVLGADDDETDAPPRIIDARPLDCHKVCQAYTSAHDGLIPEIADRMEQGPPDDDLQFGDTIQSEYLNKGESIEIVSRSQTVIILSREQGQGKVGMISYDSMQHQDMVKNGGWLHDEREMDELEKQILSGEKSGSIMKLHKRIEGTDKVALVKAMWSPGKTIIRPRNPSPGLSPVEFIHYLRCQGNQDAIVGQEISAAFTQIDGKTVVELSAAKRKRSPSPFEKNKKKDSDVNIVGAITIDDDITSGDNDENFIPNVRLEEVEGDEEEEERREEEVNEEAIDQVADQQPGASAASNTSSAEEIQNQTPADEGPSATPLSTESLEVVRPKALTKSQEELLAEMAVMAGKLEKKNKEVACLVNKVKKLKWELNLRSPVDRWKVLKGKWPRTPSMEMKAEIVGVPLHIFEQNELLMESNQSEVAGRAMISGEIRQAGETITEAVNRLGPMGLKNRRKELQASSDLEWKKLVPKTYDEIKEEVLEAARAEEQHYHFRAERIATRARERYQPAEWYFGPSFGELLEQEAENGRRINAARQGSFQANVTQLDDDKSG